MDTDLVSCPICLEGFNSTTNIPKFLSCHHTICLACIANILQKTVEDKEEEEERRRREVGEEEEEEGEEEEEDEEGRRYEETRRGGGGRGRRWGRGRRRGRERGRGTMSSPPPLSPLRLFRSSSTPRIDLEAEVEVEKADPKVEVACPMCRSRTKVEKASELQTNFYLRTLTRTPSVPRLLLWCENCSDIAEPGCGDHTLQPLPDKLKSIKTDITQVVLTDLDHLCAISSEYQRQMDTYRWLCLLLFHANAIVKEAYVKAHGNYHRLMCGAEKLQDLLDQCEEIFSREDDEEKIEAMGDLKKTLLEKRTSWLGEEEEGDEGGGGGRGGGGGGGGGGGKGDDGVGVGRMSSKCVPVLEDFFLKGPFHPPEDFQEAHVALVTNARGATLTYFGQGQVEDERKAEEEVVDGFGRSSKRSKSKSRSTSVTDSVHHRIVPHRTPSSGRTTRTLPTPSRNSPGSSFARSGIVRSSLQTGGPVFGMVKHPPPSSSSFATPSSSSSTSAPSCCQLPPGPPPGSLVTRERKKETKTDPEVQRDVPQPSFQFPTIQAPALPPRSSPPQSPDSTPEVPRTVRGRPGRGRRRDRDRDTDRTQDRDGDMYRVRGRDRDRGPTSRNTRDRAKNGCTIL